MKLLALVFLLPALLLAETYQGEKPSVDDWFQNSYGCSQNSSRSKGPWGLKNTTIYADTTCRGTYKSMGTVDTSKALPTKLVSRANYVLAWTHGSNADDSGAFAVRFLCYSDRMGAWMDTAQYAFDANAFKVTKSVSITRDTLPGQYMGQLEYCDSIKAVITSAAGTNKTDTAWVRKIGLKAK